MRGWEVRGSVFHSMSVPSAAYGVPRIIFVHMSSTPRSPRKERILRFAHFLGGALIALHAFERWEHGHATYILFAIAAVLFLALAAFHHSIAQRYPWVDAVFIGIEALLSFTIMFEFFAAGKKGLPFMYLFAGCMQLWAVRVALRRSEQKRGSGHGTAS